MMQADWAQRHKYVRRKVAAHHLQGLFDKLMPMIGTTLNGRWDIRGLYDVGGQGLIWAAGDNSNEGRPAIIKMAFLPYHRQASFGVRDIRKARQRIEEEASILRSCSGTILPELYDFFYSSNPLHLSQRGEGVIAKEPYVVMEFIEGEALDAKGRALYHENPPQYRMLEDLAVLVACELLSFFANLLENSAGHLYADVRPNNILISRDENRSIRLLDAGSVVPARERHGRSAPYSVAFLPPDYYRDLQKGQPRWPTQRSVTYALGTTLHQLLTNREPIPGQRPNFGEAVLRGYSEELVKCVEDMIVGRYADFEYLKGVFEALIRLRPASSEARLSPQDWRAPH